VKQGDSILDDTSTMKGRAALVQRVTGDMLELGPQGVVYAAAQHRRRPFLFFESPRDLNQLTKIIVEEVRRGAQRGP
jgi:hypothetical protein